MHYKTLLGQYPIISDQISESALGVVLSELERTLNQEIPGAIAEFGCYVGTTSLFIRRLLDSTKNSSERLFYAYDSFEGLPEKTSADASGAGVDFIAGALKTSKKDFLQTFHNAHLRAPITHKAWFKDLVGEQVPEQLAYAFLDGDFYESIHDSLRIVWPRLSPSGIITIDDYERTALPGVTRAVKEFFTNKQMQLRYERNIAIIKKL
jgi:O-methyltransferase